MRDTKQFEKAWLEKFQRSIDKVAGEEVRKKVLQGSLELLENYNEQNVISWTKDALHCLESLVEDEKINDIMCGCACLYPHDKLMDLKEIYAKTRDLDKVHNLLQKRFESDIKKYKQLTDEQLEYIVSRGWGVAGKKDENIIYATKIPSKFHKYFDTSNKKEKQYFYCHCPRIREVLKNDDNLSVNYCYCGAGFYKDIWEEILQRPVKIEIIKSLLKGDEVCQFKIEL